MQAFGRMELGDICRMRGEDRRRDGDDDQQQDDDRTQERGAVRGEFAQQKLRRLHQRASLGSISPCEMSTSRFAMMNTVPITSVKPMIAL